MSPLLLLLHGCPAEPAAKNVQNTVFVALDTPRLARRISIDLRGTLPTRVDLDLASEPGGLDRLIDTWLEDDRLEAHLVDVFAESWQLRLDVLRLESEEFGLGFEHQYHITRAFGDEPAHLIANVIAKNQPFTSIVTTDVTMANALLVDFLPVEWVDPEGQAEWREARYTDGRPPNGVLATSGLWLRYHTTIFNFNRGRAAALAKLLLCVDIASRPVGFSTTVDESTEGLQEAVSTDPGCLACHASLDPLAGTLWGFWPYEDRDLGELVNYHPEREGLSVESTGVQPAYFGTPVVAAAQLGQLVAADPRFAMCTARRTAERMWGRTTDETDEADVAQLRDQLIESWDYKALLRGILASEEYRAGGLVAGATAADLERAKPRRLLSPNSLASLIEEVTGFRWRYVTWDQLDSDDTGYRLLLGGADGDSVRVSNLEPTLSRSLVIRRLAQSAAAAALGTDLAAPRAGRRLVGTTTDDILGLTPDSAAFDAELDEIHFLLFASPRDEVERTAEAELFSAALAVSDAKGAWASLLAVLLRDPELWTY